jgi:hypothetical protein
MGLSAIVTKAVSAAFEAAGDLVASVTWRQRTFGAYDPATGTQATTDTDTTVAVIVAKLSNQDAARADVSDRAVRLCVKGADFAGITPRKDDLVIHGGVTYTVKSVVWAGTLDVWEAIADV